MASIRAVLVPLKKLQATHFADGQSVTTYTLLCSNFRLERAVGGGYNAYSATEFPVKGYKHYHTLRELRKDLAAR